MNQDRKWYAFRVEAQKERWIAEVLRYQGVKGEIYPCKPDIFEATYEAERA